MGEFRKWKYKGTGRLVSSGKYRWVCLGKESFKWASLRKGSIRVGGWLSSGKGSICGRAWEREV